MLSELEVWVSVSGLEFTGFMIRFRVMTGLPAKPLLKRNTKEKSTATKSSADDRHTTLHVGCS